MTVDEFLRRYPQVYHMAAATSWSSIAAHGLLSTRALLELFAVVPAIRETLTRHRRPENVTITHPVLGTAEIRDNKPINDRQLSNCLIGLEPEEWYALLNERVFFWPTEPRLVGLLSARAYRNSEHCVLTIDSAKLLDRHCEDIRLSPINTGATLYVPPKRGEFSFQKLVDFPVAGGEHRQGMVLAELSVPNSVLDICEITTTVDIRFRGEIRQHLWP